MKHAKFPAKKKKTRQEKLKEKVKTYVSLLNPIAIYSQTVTRKPLSFKTHNLAKFPEVNGLIDYAMYENLFQEIYESHQYFYCMLIFGHNDKNISLF